MARDDDFAVTLDDIDVGYDPDGTPKVIPGKREPAKDDRVEALERERDARAAEAEQATRRATEAERLAAERAQDNVRLGAGLTNAHLGNVVASIDSAKAQADSAERDYARAMEAGDYNLAAKAQRLMSQAEAQIAQREREKGEVERWLADRQSPPATTPESVRDERKAADPPKPEDIIAQMPKRSREWLGEHMEYVTDKKLNAKLQAAAYEAEHAEGLKPHTAEFIDFLEQKLGMAEREPEVEEEPEAEKPRAQRVASAPVSRGGGSSNGAGTNKLPPHLVKVARDIGWNGKLPARLARTAREIGSDPVAYAAGALQAIADGKLDRKFLSSDYVPGT